jgi:hypothetical protein
MSSCNPAPAAIDPVRPHPPEQNASGQYPGDLVAMSKTGQNFQSVSEVSADDKD